jgi:hypothetical protein
MTDQDTLWEIWIGFIMAAALALMALGINYAANIGQPQKHRLELRCLEGYLVVSWQAGTATRMAMVLSGDEWAPLATCGNSEPRELPRLVVKGAWDIVSKETKAKEY